VAAAGNIGPPVAAFDGVNVEALAALRTALVAAGGTTTLDESARGLVGALGSATAGALTAAASQSDLSAVADAARLEAHGVSIDEEMVNLLTYQRAYEASARVMTAVDQMLDTLINRTGVVGR
jgi:flagellar hook-associated protein 1 FlgK